MAKVIKDAEYCQTTGKKISFTVIRCNNCRASVELYNSWASSCDNCHTEYNGSGQELAPRSQWGEETGESF